MNYFDFYDILETFHPDENDLKKQYYALSKKYHPDFFATESEEKQQEILELSTLNNKAYQALSDPDRRLEYILSIHNLLNEGAKPQLPADFLMEMMDINERLMETDNAKQLAHISTEVFEIEDELKQQLESRTRDYAHLNPTEKENRLTEILNIYYRRKYLLRIKESLNTFATRLQE